VIFDVLVLHAKHALKGCTILVEWDVQRVIDESQHRQRHVVLLGRLGVALVDRPRYNTDPE
jgi:hypothetical protein